MIAIRILHDHGKLLCYLRAEEESTQEVLRKAKELLGKRFAPGLIDSVESDTAETDIQGWGMDQSSVMFYVGDSSNGQAQPVIRLTRRGSTKIPSVREPDSLHNQRLRFDFRGPCSAFDLHAVLEEVFKQASFRKQPSLSL